MRSFTIILMPTLLTGCMLGPTPRDIAKGETERLMAECERSTTSASAARQRCLAEALSPMAERNPSVGLVQAAHLDTAAVLEDFEAGRIDKSQLSAELDRISARLKRDLATSRALRRPVTCFQGTLGTHCY
jgi:hypothetical protein